MIESIDLTKKFGSKTAVDHISLKLENGHIYGILGPNGSGKTTWMKMADGLIQPTSGKVLFNGEPLNLNARGKIAYMSTEPYFYSWMTARSAGKYYADFFKDFSMEKYLELLEKNELNPDLKLTGYSTGMAAKMKIAITMARDAEIWMLDEPFNGIDLLARDAIRDSILSQMKPDKILLLSSHLVEEMEAIADTAVFIRQGKLAEMKTLEELRAEGTTLADRYRALYGNQEVNN